jgi:hypothetical protein
MRPLVEILTYYERFAEESRFSLRALSPGVRAREGAPYFHRPEDLRQELEEAGFDDVRVFGVEGPGWMMAEFETRWADPAERTDILAVARALESKPSIAGVSAHLLGIGRKVTPGSS